MKIVAAQFIGDVKVLGRCNGALELGKLVSHGAV